MDPSENFFELENEEWTFDRKYYELRIKKLKKDQDELAIEVIHYNNHRKFAIACYCFESTMVIISAIASCFFLSRGTPMDYLSAILIALAFVIPLTVHNTIGWGKCIKEEKLRSEGIQRLKMIQSEIDSLQNKVLY